MAAQASIKVAGAVSLALIANRMDSVHKTVGDAAIGVNRTFDPAGKSPTGVYKWEDRSGGVAVVYPTLTFSFRPPTKTSRLFKSVVKLVLPTADTVGSSTSTGITPGPSKAYEGMATLEVVVPERMLPWERQALLDNMFSLFCATITASDASPSDSTGSPLRAAIESNEPVW